MFDGKYNGTVPIIAEVKIWSPRGEQLTKNTRAKQLNLAIKTGYMISILTHPLWGGSPGDIRYVRRCTNKPILAKGFYETDEQITEALNDGATYVLVVGRQPGPNIDRRRCFFEPLTLAEVNNFQAHEWVVWNSRNLATLRDLPSIPQFLLERWKEMGTEAYREKESFEEARNVRGEMGLLVQASGLKTIADIHPRADAVLVGTHLESFAASLGITL